MHTLFLHHKYYIISLLSMAVSVFWNMDRYTAWVKGNSIGWLWNFARMDMLPLTGIDHDAQSGARAAGCSCPVFPFRSIQKFIKTQWSFVEASVARRVIVVWQIRIQSFLKFNTHLSKVVLHLFGREVTSNRISDHTKKHSTPSVVYDLGCSGGEPDVARSLLRASLPSISVITAARVSLLKPRIPLMLL